MANHEDFDIDSFLADPRPGKSDATLVDDLTGGTKPAAKPAPVKRHAKKADDFDIDAFLAKGGEKKGETPAAPAAPKQTLFQPDKMERLRQMIDRGMIPAPSWWDKVKAAVNPSEMAGDVEAAIARTYDRATAGVLPKVMEATGLVAPGRFDQLEREHPVASSAGELPAAAATLATGAPQLAGRAGAGLVGRLGGRALPAAARTIAEGGAAGGLFGAADQSIRSAGELGGQPGPVTTGDIENAAKNVATAGAVGTATGGLMSALPGAASAVEDFAHKRVLSNDLRPVKQMAKKGTLDKALLQFGKDNPEEGGKAMREFVDREGLGPVFRAKGHKMESAFNERMNQSWKEGAGPIIDKAFQLEPKASVAFSDIETQLRALAPKKGTPDAELIDKAIDVLKARQKAAGLKGGRFPLDSLLENARAFQAEGHAGVVNYDEPTARKELARKIGHELKLVVNENVGRIYAKHPEAARELLTRNPAFDEAAPGGLKPKKAATIAENLLNNEDVAAVGEKLRAGNERYSNYKKMERMVGEVGKLKAGEKKHGLIGHLLHATGLGGAAALAATISPHAIVPGMAAYEAGRLGYPFAMRWMESAARFGAGVPVDPRLRLTAPQLQAIAHPSRTYEEARDLAYDAIGEPRKGPWDSE